VGSRAQSESIGVILLTGVVVIVVAIGGAVILDGAASDADSAPLVEFTVEMTADNLTVTHAGGDVVARSELIVVARGDTTTERYDFDAENVSGDGDGQFEPSERFKRDHGLTGSTADVLVIHIPSNTVLSRESLDVGLSGGPTSLDAQFTVSPNAPDTGESVSFDASASSNPDGPIAEYRWEFGDGAVQTTMGPTVTHTYDSAGTYTAELTVVDESGDTDTAITEVVVSGPEIRIDSTALRDATDDDGVVGPGQSVTVTATVSASGTTVDTVTADASAFGAGTQSLADGNGDGTYEATFEVGSSPTPGPQSVVVTASDTADTSDTATTGTLTVDTTPPTVDSFDVTDQSFDFFLSFSVYQLDWAVSDDTSASVDISVNRTASGSNPQGTFSGPSGSETYFGGGYGQVHEIKLVATDAAGNRRCVVVTDTADGDPNSPLEYSVCG